MATNVFGSALHPLQGCGWSTCKYYCTVHFKDSKSSAPGDRNNKYVKLSSVGRHCLWTHFLLSFTALYELPRLFWTLTDSFDNLRKLQKCLAGRSSNLLEASPELYSIYLQMICSHTFTSCFRILSNENVELTTCCSSITHFMASHGDLSKCLDLVVRFTLVVNWKVDSHGSQPELPLEMQRSCPASSISVLSIFKLNRLLAKIK